MTFLDGMYDYDGIKRFLQSKTGFIDPNDENKGRIFDLYFDFTIYRVGILMVKDNELDLTAMVGLPVCLDMKKRF